MKSPFTKAVTVNNFLNILQEIALNVKIFVYTHKHFFSPFVAYYTYYSVPGFSTLTSWFGESSILAHRALLILNAITLFFFFFWILLLENVLGHSGNFLNLPSAFHTAASSKRYTLQSTPPSGTGTIPQLSPAFLPLVEKNEAVLTTALLFLPQNSWAEEKMALSGRESVDLQQWHADAWQEAQSHKTSPAIADKWHLYTEGKAQQYEISKACFICMFLL